MRPTPARAESGLMRATTILGLTVGGCAALGGDGQVTNGSVILKANARKTRRLAGGAVLAGFAGSAADGLQLFERFEAKLEAFHGNLRRAAVELAREWRSDRVLRRLDAQLAAVSAETALLLSGSGDIVEPDDGIVAVGSGGPFALAACRALRRHTGLEPARCVAEALAIAAEMCVYTGAVQEILVLPDLSSDSRPASDSGGNFDPDPGPDSRLASGSGAGFDPNPGSAPGGATGGRPS
jgi:ATP-dependent HslUV protease, peptidase subunit HslV